MSAIRKVIVAGAAGNLGPAILRALHAANFTVSVLSRDCSMSTFPPYVSIHKTDYSPSSLLRAFQGQDAVVSVVGPMGVPEQIKMIDAAFEAGVKRFIPSEFGADRTKAGFQPNFLKMQQGKIDVMDHLVKKCTENKAMTWTLFATGPLLDWALLEFPAFGFDIKARTATIYDSGNTPVSCTPRAAVGAAVANALKNPTATANRVVRTCSLQITQNTVLAALEEVTGSEWLVTHVDCKDVLSDALEKLKNKQFREAFASILAIQLFEDGTTRSLITTPEESDNSLLGVQVEGLQTFLKEIVSLAG